MVNHKLGDVPNQRLGLMMENDLEEVLGGVILSLFNEKIMLVFVTNHQKPLSKIV